MNSIRNIAEYLERLSVVQRNAALEEAEEQTLIEARLFMKEFGENSVILEPTFISKMRTWYRQQLEQSHSLQNTENIIQFSTR